MSPKKTSSKSQDKVAQSPMPKGKSVQQNTKQAGAGIEYTNRKRKTYYLHVGKTKKGNPRYHFAMKAPDEPVNEIPEGYEVYENPNAMVFLRKILPKEISDEEIGILEKELEAHSEPTNYKIDIKGEIITIFWSDQSSQRPAGGSSFFRTARMQEFFESTAYFMPIFRFTLVDSQKRLFIAERFCFLGSIDDWIDLRDGGPDSLPALANTFVRHFGRKSFYELM
jgi:hypothetical protein